MKRTIPALLLASAWSLATFAQGAATVFEGARVIVGDGRVIDNATIVVNAGKIAQVGPAANVKAPAGATRVSLTGKTVMPTIVDTHVHTSQTREALTQDLTRRAYYGVSAAMSLGQDTGDLPVQIRDEVIPNAARYKTAGRGSTMPEPEPGAERCLRYCQRPIVLPSDVNFAPMNWPADVPSFIGLKRTVTTSPALNVVARHP